VQPGQRPIDPVNAIGRIADILGEKRAGNNARRVDGYSATLYGYILPVEIRQAGNRWTGLMGLMDRRNLGRDDPGRLNGIFRGPQGVARPSNRVCRVLGAISRWMPGAVGQRQTQRGPLPYRHKGYATKQAQYKQPYNQQPVISLKMLKNRNLLSGGLALAH